MKGNDENNHGGATYDCTVIVEWQFSHGKHTQMLLRKAWQFVDNIVQHLPKDIDSSYTSTCHSCRALDRMVLQ